MKARSLPSGCAPLTAAVISWALPCSQHSAEPCWAELYWAAPQLPLGLPSTGTLHQPPWVPGLPKSLQGWGSAAPAQPRAARPCGGLGSCSHPSPAAEFWAAHRIWVCDMEMAHPAPGLGALAELSWHQELLEDDTHGQPWHPWAWGGLGWHHQRWWVSMLCVLLGWFASCQCRLFWTAQSTCKTHTQNQPAFMLHDSEPK